MSSKSYESSCKRSGVVEKKSSYQEGKRLQKKTRKDPSDDSITTCESTELVLFNHSFNAPNFSKKSLVSSQSKGPSGCGSYFVEMSKKGKISSETVVADRSSLDSGGSHMSKVTSLSRYFKNLSHSRGSVGTVSLKKTAETTDFSTDNFESDTCSIQCAAERLKLEDEEKPDFEIPSRSDLFPGDSILNDVDVDSQGDGFTRDEKKIQNYVPFQKDRNSVKESSELVVPTKGGKKFRNFWSKNSISSLSQVMAYFTREEKNEPTREKYKPENKENDPQLDGKDNQEDEQDKPKKKKRKKRLRSEMIVKYLDPPVPYEEDLETKKSMHQLFFFYLQLICLTILAMSMVSSEMYFFTDLISKEFFDTPFFPNENSSSTPAGGRPSKVYHERTLRHSTTIDDFWAFCESTLIALLYLESFPLSRKDENNKKLLQENQILGVARIRQVRVRTHSCSIHKNFKRFFDDCYAWYSVFDEDTKNIKDGMENSSTGTAWVYTEAEDLNSSYYWGSHSLYGGGGYYLDLAIDKDGAKNMITELKDNNWVTSATRAIFLNFNLYNANINLFCICRIVWELPPLGGVFPGQDFQSLKLIRYLNTFDFFVLAAEFVFLIFVANDTIQEVQTINKERTSYLFSWWNLLNVSRLLLAYTYVLLSIIRKIFAVKLISELDSNYYRYTEFHSVKTVQIIYNYVIAILLFFTWIKLFTLFSFTKIMLQFKKTLSKSIKDMAQFLPIFISMLMAFTFLGYLLFGNQVESYRTIGITFLTLLQAFLGEFNYGPILEVNEILGAFYYVAFVFFIFFVLLNVFIAIINDAYMTIKSQVVPHSPRVMEYIKRGFVNAFTCSRPLKLKKSRGINRKKVLFYDIKKALRRAGFSEDEIAIFFHKYNINCGNFLQDDTRTKIMKDLELKTINFKETSDQFQIDCLRRRLDEFKERIENWEMKIQPVIDKVDILLHRL